MNKILLLSLLLIVAPTNSFAGEGHGHHGEEEEHEEHKEGPHGGRVFGDEDFEIEITIYEKGIPPEYRIYFYEQEKLIDPKSVNLRITLTRLGPITDEFSFKAEGDYLRSVEVVKEPHSFDVSIEATYKGTKHEWSYESHEGRAKLDERIVTLSGIKVEKSGPRKIKTLLRLNGRIGPNADRLTHLTPRFPGIVKKVLKNVGEEVAVGDVLAQVESNESLRTYDITSQISGTVVSKHASLGEFINEDQDIFIVADLSTVWADLKLFPADFKKVALGQDVLIWIQDQAEPISAEISYVSSFGDKDTQAKTVRVEIPNENKLLYPGIFVSADVITEEVEVPIAVSTKSLQTFRNWTVVFIKVGDTFEIRPVELGRKDSEYVQVLSGLNSNQDYVSENSFILKADVLKSGATHNH